ncbi:hypothetical protein [Streptomyces bugieae]|uniref:Lipoprotein n=1 Tax=Streptomyces bugieae TaxID=3098223 RepID=A0ABU7NMP4_9ACTN|nr:hypothetical protein [Streptomyces sp. DSM 41528]
MRTTTAAAVIAATCFSLAACGASGSDKADAQPQAPKPSHSRFDCSESSLSQVDWVKHCKDAGPQKAKRETGSAMALGKTAETIGAQNPIGGETGGGGLEVTPTSVLYVKKAMGSTSSRGVYAIVTVKDRAPNAVAAAESAPIEGGGWQWIAPDGQALSEGDGDASSIVPNGFESGGMVQAGTYKWTSRAFDITNAQRGGTLLYTDGAGKAYRWKVSATDTGPELAALKKGMAGNYG